MLYINKNIAYAADVVSEAEQIKFNGKHFRTRKEVRGVTIDGAGSPDLDDAIWVQKKETGYLVQVHIADPAALIDKNSMIFKKALKQKHSYYFSDGTQHMLPPRLSTHLLSLNEGQIRLTVTIEVELNRDLDIVNRQVYKSKFVSLKRLDYVSSAEMMRRPDTEIGKMLETAYKVSTALIRKRYSRNRRAHLMEVEKGYYLDKNGVIGYLGSKKSKKPESIIYGLMILANETISNYFVENKMEGIFRNHNRLKAKYGVRNHGHKSLNVGSYFHFTSPIRRLADLINHMILHARFNSQKKPPFTKNRLKKIAKHLNS